MSALVERGDVEPRNLQDWTAEADGDEYDPVYDHAQVDQDSPVGALAALRIDFGAHLEANYQRLVAQLYAITLDAGEAHDAVQEAYSRAWRSWATISRQPDPSAWVRSVAVRSTARSWRRMLARFGIGGRPKPVQGVDPRTGALLGALARLDPAARRTVVLFHMAGASLTEIATIEQVNEEIIEARLGAARNVVVEGLADVLPAVLADERSLPERADSADPGRRT